VAPLEVLVRSIRFVALVLVASTAVAVPGRADTIISGGNIINQTWTAVSSPYIVLGDITVPVMSTLTIEPGVTVQLATSDAVGGGLDAARVEITVNGTLHVIGTSVQPVTFQSQGAPGPGRWYGIVANAGSIIQMDHAILTGAVQAMRVTPFTIFAEQVRIEDSTQDLVALASTLTVIGLIEAGKLTGNIELNLSLNRVASTCAGNIHLHNFAAGLASALSYEQLQVTGTVRVSGNLQLDTQGLNVAPGTMFTLVAQGGADPAVGSLLDFPEGQLAYNGSHFYRISYVGGTGNDIVATIDQGPPDVSVTKSGPATLPFSAGGISYTVTVSSLVAPAQGVVLLDELPVGLVFESATPSQGSCSAAGRSITCNLGDLGTGGSATVVITAQFNFSQIVLQNVASATSTSGDANPLDNQDTVSTIVTSVPLGVGEEDRSPGRRIGSHPNPARSTTRISFAAPAGALAIIEIFDSAGRLVRDLRQHVGTDGAFFDWDGRDARGQAVRPGVFLYRATIEGQPVGSDKITIVR